MGRNAAPGVQLMALGLCFKKCCGNCLDKFFKDGLPETAQADLDGNAYSTTGAPSQTSACCGSWTPVVMDAGFAAQSPSCYPAGFTQAEFLQAVGNGCVIGFGWDDRTCGSPSAYRQIWAWIATHPVTGNIWVFAGARIYYANPAPVEWDVIVEGALDTGLTEITLSDGPFTVPLDAACTSIVTDPTPSIYTHLGCWSTTLGNIVITL